MRQPLPPLPGTGRPPRGLFIDHLGTLLERPKAGYLQSPEEVVFTPEALEAIFHATQAGWTLYLIGNESSVYQGLVSPETWDAIHATIQEGLRSHGICPMRSYICIDHPEGPKPFNKESVYRLPNTGAMYHAAQADGISLPTSWVIGDHTEDVAAGWRAGCHMAGVRSGEGLKDGTLQVEPEIVAENLAAVLREITSGSALTRY